MKAKLRFAKTFAAMMVALSLCISNVHAYSNDVQSLYLDDNETYSGKIIPAEMSTAAFANEVDYDSLADFQFKRAISISGDHVSVDLSLLIDSSEIQLHYDGKMYKSSRYTDENPVYVGALENDGTTDFELIYFEISNDISPYNLNKDLRNCASITMYLQCNEGTIYDLGSKIVSPIILDTIEKQAPSDKDITWFLNYFRGTLTESQDPRPNSTYDHEWEGDLKEVSYTVAGYEHLFTARPYADIVYGDVPAYGEFDFSVALKISESHRYRYIGEKNWVIDTGDYGKCFAIENVQLGWTAGANTRIIGIEPHLNEHNKGGDAFTFTGVVATITSFLPVTAPISDILALADSLMAMDGGDSNSFTNTAYGGGVNVAAYKMQFPQNFYIEESGLGVAGNVAERFELIARMATLDSSLSRKQKTAAVATLSFDFCWGDMTGNSGSKTYNVPVQVNYFTNC